MKYVKKCSCLDFQLQYCDSTYTREHHATVNILKHFYIFLSSDTLNSVALQLLLDCEASLLYCNWLNTLTLHCTAPDLNKEISRGRQQHYNTQILQGPDSDN